MANGQDNLYRFFGVIKAVMDTNFDEENTTQHIPQCVGFIMDGNRRWAKEQELDSFFGHKAGEDKFYEVAQWVKDKQIAHAVFYAFSTENWFREKFEVTYLEDLFLAFATKILSEIHERQVRIRVIGNLENFQTELKNKIFELEQASLQYKKTTIWVALSYGGRAELVSAINKAVVAGTVVDEASFSKLLSTAEMPDPDLIIRTSGETRLSNFLPWQSVYSELFFTDTYWPAFTKEEFTRIVSQYGDRQRRRGK